MLTGLLILALCASLGLSVAARAGWRERPALRLFFAPLLGLAMMIHLAALGGWLFGMHRPLTLPVTLLLAAAALLHERARWRGLLHSCALAAAAFAAGGWALWTCLWRFGALNPFNDTFTYLVHAQWLQSNPFRHAAVAAIETPALTQVSSYQAGQLRMGASFLLGWVQSVAGAAWAHEVWPAVIVLPMACGALALAGAVWLATRRRRWLCLSFALLPGLSLNGLTFAQVYGFLPQSFGLAFAFGALVMAAQGGRLLWPAALCLSAHVYCYPEALPFTLAGWAALLLLRRPAWRPLLLGLALALPELPRAWHAVRYLAGLRVGVDRPISAIESFGHATGLFSGPWDDRASIMAPLVWVVLIALAGFRWRTPVLLACAGVLAALSAAWLWFTLVEPNPWRPGETGNPWRQARAASWAVWPALLLVSAGLARWWPRARWAVSAAMAIWFCLGAWTHYRLAAPRMVPVQREVLCTADCLPRLMQIPAQAPRHGSIWLNGFLPEHGKFQQFVTYLLIDRPVLADWSGDDYIQRDLRTDPRSAAWSLTATPAPVFRPMRDTALLLGMEGGYALEHSGSSSFRWTARELRYRFALPPATARVRVRFALETAGVREVRLQGSGLAPLTVSASEAIFPAPPGPEWTLVFSTDQPPRPAVPGESRALAFLVRDLEVEPLR